MDTIERILYLITEKNLKDSDITKVLSLSNGVVGQWRKRKQNPSTEAIIKLAQYFGVTTDYLLCITDYKTVAERYEHENTQALISAEADEIADVYQKLDISGKRQLMGKAYEFLDKLNKKENAPAEEGESEEAVYPVPVHNMAGDL